MTTARLQPHKHIKRTKDDYIISTIAYTIVCLFALLCFIPFLLVIIYSFTPYDLYLKNHFDFFPERLTLDAYQMVVLPRGGERLGSSDPHRPGDQRGRRALYPRLRPTRAQPPASRL